MPLEARIDEQVNALDERHELHPERLRQGADEDPTVARSEDAVVRVDAARISTGEERAALAWSAHVRAATEGERAGDGAHLDTLPWRSAQPSEKRRRDAESGERTGHVSDDRGHEPHRPPGPRPLHRLRSGDCGDQRLVRRQPLWMAFRTPGAHSAVDTIRRRVGLGRGLVGEQHVGARAERTAARRRLARRRPRASPTAWSDAGRGRPPRSAASPRARSARLRPRGRRAGTPHRKPEAPPRARRHEFLRGGPARSPPTLLRVLPRRGQIPICLASSSRWRIGSPNSTALALARLK